MMIKLICIDIYILYIMYTTLCYIIIYLRTTCTNILNDDEHADGGGRQCPQIDIVLQRWELSSHIFRIPFAILCGDMDVHDEQYIKIIIKFTCCRLL